MSNLSEEEKEKKIIKKLHGKIFSENLTGKYYERTWIEGSELIELSQLIEKQQKEIDNRIPISEIEKILEATKQLREKEIKELGMSLRGSAVDILENILKNYKEN